MTDARLQLNAVIGKYAHVISTADLQAFWRLLDQLEHGEPVNAEEGQS